MLITLSNGQMGKLKIKTNVVEDNSVLHTDMRYYAGDCENTQVELYL